MEQMLVVVDGSDRVLGYTPRSLCHAGSGRLHRAVLVLLYDGQRRLLLQKRKAELWDGYWDLAGATHPLHLATHDESYESAGQRMLREE